ECNECDYWVIWGGLKETEAVRCSPSNVIYLVDEAHEQRRFNEKFLKQFGVLFSCRTDLVHPCIINVHDMGIWHMPISYRKMVDLNPIEKANQISVVASDRVVLPGHKKRFAFVNQLIGHFK